MADALRKSQITSKLLQLTQQQQKALEDATFLGWLPGTLDAYQKRGEQISLLREQLIVAISEGPIEILPDTPPLTPDVDAEQS